MEVKFKNMINEKAIDLYCLWIVFMHILSCLFEFRIVCIPDVRNRLMRKLAIDDSFVYTCNQ